MIDGIKLGSYTGFECPLCASREGTVIYEIKIKGIRDRIEEYNCKKCGTFYFDYVFFDENKLSPRDLPLILNHYLLNKKTKNEKCIYSFKERKNKGDIIWVNPRKLANNWPKDTLQRIEKTLANMYLYFNLNKSGSLWLNQYLFENLSFASGKLSCDEELDEITRICEMLEDSKYITKKADTDGPLEYALTLEGMKKAESVIGEIRQTLPQAFVAIFFNQESKKRYDVLKVALEECGYVALRMDEKEHNKQIVPEIKSEIRNSDFVVVELIGHRNSVYFEAGFAEGIGKEVIYTCHKDELEAVNFDIRQVNLVLYESEDELKNKLIQRIRATVPTKQKPVFDGISCEVI